MRAEAVLQIDVSPNLDANIDDQLMSTPKPSRCHRYLELVQFTEVVHSDRLALDVNDSVCSKGPPISVLYYTLGYGYGYGCDCGYGMMVDVVVADERKPRGPVSPVAPI